MIDICGSDLDFFILDIEINRSASIFILFKMLICFFELIFLLGRLHRVHLTETILTIFR
jgi:hypothetical protein